MAKVTGDAAGEIWTARRLGFITNALITTRNACRALPGSMISRSYSFLDVAVLKAVGERFAAGDALLILSERLDEVLWTNGPGARIFGFSDVLSLIGADPELPLPVRRQIEATPGYPRVGHGRPIMLRLASGVSSRAIGFSASGVTMPDGEDAILLAASDALGAARTREEAGTRAIEGLSGEGQFVALVDEEGALVAASPGFGGLGIGAETLRELAEEVAGESDRLVKRLVQAERGPLPAGMARLAASPALNLLMVIDDTAEGAQAQTARPAAPAGPEHPEAHASEPVARESEATLGTARGTTTGTAPGTTAGSPAEGAAGDVTGETASGTEPAAPSDEAPEGIRAEAGADEDEWYFNAAAEEEPGPAAAATAVPDAADLPQPAIDPAAMPVRFVWRTDAQGRFSALSQEFGAAFGAEAADVVGRSFSEVARVFGLDPDGEIAGLLERRDTWSGRSVLWPVAGTDLKVPVDLAALPVYGRDRDFEGFRGFGVARMGDAVIDPEAIGLMLRPMPAGDGPTEQEHGAASAAGTAGREPEPGEDPFRGEVPALEVSPSPERRGSDKVIQLAERRPNGTRALSPAERLNFDQIGQKLRSSGLVAEPAAEDLPAEPTEATTLPDAASLAAEPRPLSNGHDISSPVEPPQEQETGAAEPGEAAAQAEEPATEATPDHGPQGGPATQREFGAGEPERSGTEPPGSTERAREDAAERTAMGEPAAAAEPEEASRVLAAGPHADGVSPGEGDAAPTEEEVQPESESQPVGAAQGATRPGPEEVAARREAEAFLPSAFAGLAANMNLPGIDAAVLSRLPLPLLIHSGDALFFANQEFLQLTGYGSLAELETAGGLGTIFGEPYAAEDRAERKLRLRRRDGAECPVDAFLQSIAWNGGKALLLALRRSEAGEIVPQRQETAPPGAEAESDAPDARLEELRTIIDTATDGVVIIGNDGRIRSISRPAEALFGFNGFEVVGREFASLFAIESQKAASDYLAGLAENGVASVLNDGREVIGREAQGRFIPLFMTIGRLPNNSGFCAVVRDITQWKRAEEELTQARAEAERASSQKTEFLARVSHEIRTPLNAIIGFSELMIDEKFGPIHNDRYKDYLRDINKSGNHVLDLVNDLLDISKIEAGQQEMTYEAVSLGEVLGEAVAMMQPQANRERVIIRSSFASRLPDVVADLRSMRQIALNLLSNAIRYTPAGGQVIVSTAYEQSGDIVVRVRDTGIGMAAAEIDQALKPFKQINALKRPRGDGTGLGLPLTKAMVEANRARFAIHSQPGEGTLVEITFPSTRVLAH